MDRIHARCFLVLVFSALAGCEKPSPPAVAEGGAAPPAPSLISERDRRHDFGAVIGAPGRKREHRYRLVNTTSHDVRILEVVNRKTCCGVVAVGPTMLKPGEATDVDVTLIIGDKFGEVSHETEVVTDLASEPSVVLRTSAQAVPAVRIEEAADREEGPLIAGGEPRLAGFQVFASGTPDEAPVDLDHMELRSTVKADWSGPKETRPSEDGLVVESRRFVAMLDSSGPPGERRAEYLLQIGEHLHGRHVVAWEVVAPLRISPRMIVLRPDQGECRLVVAARDRRPFRITKVECQSAGIQARSASAEAAPSHELSVGGVPKPGQARGVVSIFTDHPDQQRIDVPYVLID